MSTFALNANLHQLVKQCTWSRVINGNLKESLLDHIYVNKLENVLKITYSVPTFGDYKFISIELDLTPPSNDTSLLKHDWSKYDPNLINDKMAHDLLYLNNMNADVLTVNVYWNVLETVLIKTNDCVAPLVEVKMSPKTQRNDLPIHVS